jgi:hypothetical protein
MIKYWTHTPFFLGASVLAVIASAQAAQADIATVHNTTVSVNPAGANANGMNFGTGNQNGGFNVVTETDGANSVEIGARIQLRSPQGLGYIAPTPSDSATYDAPTGYTQKYGLNLGLWDYTFSVLAKGYAFNGANPLSVNLTVSDGQTTSGPLNLLLIPDNNQGGSPNRLLAPTDTEIQNSENLAFPGFFPGYNPSSADHYTFTLTVSGGGLASPVSNTITANVGAPEPSTWSLMLLGVSGVGFSLRRRGKALLSRAAA